MTDAEERFTGRADNYVRYRIGYPAALIDVLERECRLTSQSVVADIGSGTGTLTRMLLDRGSTVYGIEPNAEMRSAAERALADYERFTSVAARAEATTLPNRSMDLATVGRALQWFDVPAALREMARVLKPSGWIAVVWNRRDSQGSPVAARIDELLRRYCEGYESLTQRRRAAVELLERRGFRLETISMPKAFTLEQLIGHVLSLSVAPDEGHPSREPLLRELNVLFAEHDRGDGTVLIEHITKIYYGRPVS